MRLDLEQALALALERNLSFTLGSIGPRAARLDLASAEAGFALRLAPELAADRSEDAGATTVGLLAARRFAWGTELSARAAHDTAADGLPAEQTWSVELAQPLLRRFGPLVHREPVVAAGRALEAAERSLAQQQADLVLEVVAAYENLLRLERQVEADRKAVERSRLLARLTAAQERLGRATRIDSLRVDLQLGQLETRLQASVERLDLAHQDLAILLGADPASRFALADAPRLGLELPPLAEALAVALSHRLDYAQALEDAADGERRSRIVRRELLPDLAATLSYDDRGEVQAGAGAGNGALLVGLRVSGDLVQPAARAAYSRSLLDQEGERQRVRIVEQLVARDVQSAWLAYRRARAEVPLLERNLEHAEARLELASRLFKAGRGDNFTVVDAEEAFVLAESELLDALAAETIDGYRLLRALGNLVEVPAHLKPRIPVEGAAP
jgi:outer membrane protein